MQFVFGIVVDSEVYSEYAARTYYVNGETCSLATVEDMATSKGYDVFPEIKEAAKKVMEKVQNEIKAYYAKLEGKNGFVAGKHMNFVGYLDDLKIIYEKAAAARMELKQSLDAIEADWKSVVNDKELPESERLREKAAYMDVVEANKKAIVDLKIQTQQEIDSVSMEFKNGLASFYTVDGSKLNDEDVKILNSGIALTDTEMQQLLVKYQSNPTMLRMIDEYCERKNIDNILVKNYGHVAKEHGKTEEKIFTYLSNLVMKAVSANPQDVTVWVEKKEYFEDYYQKAVKEMQELPVKPAEQ